MFVLDVNILLYAFHAGLPEHKGVSEWLTRTVNRQEQVRIPWLCVHGFVRIATNARVFSAPLTADEAWGCMEQLLEAPSVVASQHSRDEWLALRDVMKDGQVVGGMVTDAVLAAHTLALGGTLATNDKGFARFAKLRTFNPVSE
jgi:uncharacterized protein